VEYERTDEHKQRMSDATKKAWTPERRAKYAEQRKGAANPFFGKRHTEEQKQERSKKMSGKENPFFGRKHSPETIEKLSAARKGWSQMLAKYGVTREQYTERLAAGFMWCSYHKDFALADEFTTRWGHKSKAGRCKRCVWVAMLRCSFDVTPEWYEQKLAEQGGGCAICGLTPDQQKRNMPVDHSHTSNAVRGVLCHRCNTSLERIELIPGWAEKALAYLKSYAAA
jgi:hypothetical protein